MSTDRTGEFIPDRTGEFIPDHPATIAELIGWMQSVEGTVIRGRNVIDLTLDFSADGSGRVYATVSAIPGTKRLIERVVEHITGESNETNVHNGHI